MPHICGNATGRLERVALDPEDAARSFFTIAPDESVTSEADKISHFWLHRTPLRSFA